MDEMKEVDTMATIADLIAAHELQAVKFVKTLIANAPDLQTAQRIAETMEDSFKEAFDEVMKKRPTAQPRK